MNKFLIVGLGNPGSKYQNTRHNIGFDILDFISEKNETDFETERLGDLSKISIRGKKVFLLKPSTFMNLSGKAVKYWMRQENIKIENLLVISDDLNLPLGKVRLRASGSSGGHNGLENIESILNSKKYARLRIGISNPNENFNQVDFVLGKFNEEEYDLLSSEFSNIAKLIRFFVISGVDQTMNNFNN